MGDSILSQAEIDALLNGDSDTKDEPTPGIASDSDIRPYDPNTQRRVVRERLQALEIINERFARQFRMDYLTRCAAARILPWVPYVFSRITNLRVTCRYRPT